MKKRIRGADKYDDAMKYLNRYPEEIQHAWNEPVTHPAGCLFMYAGSGPSRMSFEPQSETKYSDCGCLTAVKHGQKSYHGRTISKHFVAGTRELTAAIKADPRIPKAEKITVKDLPVFAEWQRRLDRELDR